MRSKQLIVSPRGTAKSTIVSFVWVLYNVCFRLASLILLVSESYTKAAMFIDQIKTEIETNRELREVFQLAEGEPWSRGDIVILVGDKRARILAKGAGQSIRGIVQEKRIELAIIDDVEHEGNVKTKASRDALKSWFYGQVIPALEPKTGRVIVVGTNIHYDSLIANLLKNEETWHPLVFSILDENGKSIWEERFPTDYINQIKEEYAKDGKLNEFYAEYMNQPLPPSERPLDVSLVRYFNRLHILKKKLYYYCAVDPAASERAEADNTAIAVVAHDDIGNVYVMDMSSGKMHPSKIADEIERFANKYPLMKIGVEAVGGFLAFYKALSSELASRGSYLPLHPIKFHRKTKKERILGYLEPKISLGKFYLDPTHPETINIMDELKDFVADKETHDDRIDAIALAISLMEETLVAPNVRSIYYEGEQPAPNIYLP